MGQKVKWRVKLVKHSLILFWSKKKNELGVVKRVIFILFDFPQSYWIHDALSLWKTKPCFFCCELSYDSLGWGLGPFVRNDATWGKNTFTCKDCTPQIYWISTGFSTFPGHHSWGAAYATKKKASIMYFEPCDLPFHEDAIFTFTS